MRTDERHLNDTALNLQAWPPLPKEEQSLIVSEICARLIEWRSLHPALIESKPLIWLLKLSRLAKDSPDAFWIYIAIQSGDPSQLTKTFQEQASERALDRQAIEQRFSRALSSMQLHFPELSSTISHLHHTFRPPRGVNVK